MADLTAWFSRHGWRLQEAPLWRPHPNPTFRNGPFEASPLKVLIVRLSPFGDVERSFPHLFLADAVRRGLRDAYVDLAFLPPRADRQRRVEAGIPLLVGGESCRTVDEFDLVLVSTSYVLELVNLPYLLHHSSIPLSAKDRQEGWPPIILGGSNALASTVVCGTGSDCLVDGLFFGEGERVVPELVRSLVSCRSGTRARLCGVDLPGLWVFGRHAHPVPKSILRAPTGDDLPLNYPILNGEEAHTARLQITFGCPTVCSFCFEGHDRLPYREVPLDDLVRHARRLKALHGATRVELMSFNANAHRDLASLLLALHRLFDEVTITSQRIDALAPDPALLDAQIAAGKLAFTFGIEGVSERLRAFLQKRLAPGAIETVLRRLLRERIRELKLSFVLTGHEGEADWAEFRAFLRNLKAWRRAGNEGIRVIISAGRLVRMPGTPLEYDRPILDEEEWAPLVRGMKSCCETNGFEFRLSSSWAEYVMGQLLARGDGRLLPTLVELARRGFCFDGVVPPDVATTILERARSVGMCEEASLTHGAFVRGPVSPEALRRQFQRARAALLQPSGARDGRVAEGASGTQFDHTGAPSPKAPTSPQLVASLRALVETKRRLLPLFVRVRIEERLAGLHPAWLEALLVRILLAERPVLTDSLFGAREALFLTPRRRSLFPGFFGETVVALRGIDRSALEEAVASLAGACREGIAVLGVEPSCGPERLETFRVGLRLPREALPDAEGAFVRWLRARHVSCYTTRELDATRSVVSTAGKKKRLVLEGSSGEHEGQWHADLLVGRKFAPGDFLAFCGEQRLANAVRCRVSDLGFQGP